MKPYTLHLGDCIEVMRTMGDASVDAIVCDPPYELGFMGKTWDSSGIAYNVDMWREALRVLKPGGHLLAFSGSRTYHRMTCAIEDAGFEVRDQIMWVYGSGFPKSRNLDAEWQGWGTALKPAHEPIAVARKPLVGTVAANVLAHGTGALNINSCRVNPGEAVPGGGGLRGGAASRHEGWKRLAHMMNEKTQPHDAGRWPANLIHDGSPEVVALFPESAGAQGDVKGTEKSRTGGEGTNCYGEYGRVPSAKRGDTGSAARFFYCAKASRRDRNEGCEHMEKKPLHWSSGDSNPGSFQSNGTDKSSQNNHPTVKPTDLMAYLVRLVTPPGGLVLDPFMGSGSTGKAAMREGFRFAGIDLSPEYLSIAEARIEHELARVTAAAAAPVAAPQLDLFAIDQDLRAVGGSEIETVVEKETALR